MFKIGNQVKWNDPCIDDYPEEDRDMVANRLFTITDIKEDIILISDGFSEAEVTEREIELL